MLYSAISKNGNFINKKRERLSIEEILTKEETKQKQQKLSKDDITNEIKRNNLMTLDQLEKKENKNEEGDDLTIPDNNDYSLTLDKNNQKNYENQTQMKYTLKININKVREEKAKELLKTKMKYKYQNSGYNSKFNKLSKREIMMKKGFNFIEKGSFLKNKDNIQKKNIQNQEENEVKNIQNLMKVKPNFQTNTLQLTATNFIPDIEPWDITFLNKSIKNFLPINTNEEDTLKNMNISFSQCEDYINKNETLVKSLFSKVNIYIQHPIPIKNELIERRGKVTIPVYLTKKEKKRAKRIKKMEQIKKENEMVKLGLAQPRPTKLTYKNFIQIFKDESVNEPSLIENKVKKAYADRYQKMLNENEKNKLTKEQRKEKIRKKYEKDSKKECKAVLIKINKLKSNKNRFKIDKNSKQFFLTGICLMNRECKFNNLLYLEGGPLAIKKMIHLLMSRINWKETEYMQNNEHPENNCIILWEGSIKKRNFDEWKMQEIKNEGDGFLILKNKNLEYMWNMVNIK